MSEKLRCWVIDFESKLPVQIEGHHYGKYENYGIFDVLYLDEEEKTHVSIWANSRKEILEKEIGLLEFGISFEKELDCIPNLEVFVKEQELLIANYRNLLLEES